MKYSQITAWGHEIIRSQVPEGGFYIDATMGKGKDTLLFCELAGETGKVRAFDIQQQAVDATAKLLKEHGMEDRAALILDGHEHMEKYAPENTADCICFNFGYLPGGDHTIATKPETSIRGIEAGLKILKPGGLMCLTIYSGGDTGYEEKDSILKYLRTLSPKEFTVIVNQYYNRDNDPPLPVFIWK